MGGLAWISELIVQFSLKIEHLSIATSLLDLSVYSIEEIKSKQSIIWACSLTTNSSRREGSAMVVILNDYGDRWGDVAEGDASALDGFARVEEEGEDKCKGWF